MSLKQFLLEKLFQHMKSKGFRPDYDPLPDKNRPNVFVNPSKEQLEQLNRSKKKTK
jgi:hypothetical protein